MAQTYKGIFWKTAVPQGCPGSTRRLCAENIREILTVLEVAPLSQFLVEKGLLRIWPCNCYVKIKIIACEACKAAC